MSDSMYVKNDPTYYEQYHKAANQTIESYKHLMLGGPVTFTLSIFGAWMLFISGSITYWSNNK